MRGDAVIALLGAAIFAAAVGGAQARVRTGDAPAVRNGSIAFDVFDHDRYGHDVVVAGSLGGSTRPLRTGSTRQIAGGTSAPYNPSWRPVCDRSGTPRADRITGRARAELVCGSGGNDTITGGGELDRLFGGDGNDRLLARDGAFDVVGCGPGRDTVVADHADLVGVDCEYVLRR